MKTRLLGWLSFVLAAIAIAAALTAISFGGELSDYIAAPYCVHGQHSTTTACREVYQTAVSSTQRGNPCVATFTNASTTDMDCNVVWQSLKPGSLATLELWHGEVVGVANQVGISQTDAYPQDTGRLFIALAVALGIIALVFGGIFFQLHRVGRQAARANRPRGGAEQPLRRGAAEAAPRMGGVEGADKNG